MRRKRFGNGRPIGKLPSGERYYAPIGAMRYDGDRVHQCHLCGRWLKMVGGVHLLAAHGITTAQYREMFRLFATVSTVSTGDRGAKRASMLAQISSGERDRSVLGSPSPPTVGRWRSLGALHPELMREWHATRNDAVDPYRIGLYSHRKV